MFQLTFLQFIYLKLNCMVWLEGVSTDLKSIASTFVTEQKMFTNIAIITTTISCCSLNGPKRLILLPFRLLIVCPVLCNSSCQRKNQLLRPPATQERSIGAAMSEIHTRRTQSTTKPSKTRQDIRTAGKRISFLCLNSLPQNILNEI